MSSEATTTDRRTTRRHQFFNRVRVVANGSDRCIDLHAFDVSPRGMYLYGDRPLPTGTRVGIEIETSRHGPIWVRGCEVAWGTSEWIGSRPPGMGIQFYAVPEAARRAIDRLVDELVEENRKKILAPPPHLRLGEPGSRPYFDARGAPSRSHPVRWWNLLWIGLLVVAVNVTAVVLARDTPPSPVEPATPAEPAIRVLPRVGAPVFQLTDGKWRMVLEASAPVPVRHFTMRRPARLVLDVMDAEYAAERTRLRPPVPFVHHVRVGKHPGRIRYVVEFKKRVPVYEVAQRDNGVAVAFRR